MNKTSTAFIIALFFAGIATLLIYRMQNQDPNLHILVAKQPLEAGTALNLNNTYWKELPKSLVTNDYIAQDSNIARYVFNQKVNRDVKTDEIITLSSLKDDADSKGLADVIAPGKHAMIFAIPFAFNSDMRVASGDTIDIILTRELPKSSSGWAGGSSDKQYVSEVLLHNVKILVMRKSRSNEPAPQQDKAPLSFMNNTTSPMNSTFSNNNDSNARGNMVMLEVSTDEAEVIALGQQIGKLTIMLSSKNDPQDIKKTQPYVLSRDVGYINNPGFHRYHIMKGSQEETIEVKE